MKSQTARDIIECLPKGHTPFNYSRDDYAFYLLSRATENKSLPINLLKKSDYASLIHKQKVKQFLAEIGSHTLTPDLLQYGIGGLDSTKFNLTLGTWGSEKTDLTSWTQTTRGKANLVLQLNWDMARVKKFQKETPERKII